MPTKKWTHMSGGGIQKNRRKQRMTPRSANRKNLSFSNTPRKFRTPSTGSPEQQIVSDVLTARAPEDAQNALKRLTTKFTKDVIMGPPPPPSPRPEIALTHVFPQSEEDLQTPRKTRSNSASSEISVISTATHDARSSHYSADSDDGPQTPVYLLTEMESILNEARAGCFIALDIDETLIVTRCTPSRLLTTQGVQSFQKYVHKRFADFNTKNQHCRNLQKALKDKVLVSDSTANCIRKLQEKGCVVFGLTARYGEMATLTDKSLLALDIDLTKTSPFPPQVLKDSATGTLVQNGIIYCSNQDKGAILKNVFESVVFRTALVAVREMEMLEGKNEGYSDDDQDTVQTAFEAKKTALLSSYNLPEEFYFVDDVYDNSSSVCSQLTPVIFDELSIMVSCYHYVPPNLAELQADAPCNEEDSEKILNKQMDTFVNDGTILTNDQARSILGIAPSCF